MSIKNGHITSSNDIGVVTTKGDIFTSAGPGSPARLGVGLDGEVIVADSSAPYGLKWEEKQAQTNYIKATTGQALGIWSTYKNTTAATSPESGTGASASVITFTNSISSAMRGSTNFLLAKTANNAQGEGFSYLCNISPADRGKVLRFNFEYLVDSGTYSSGDLTVWFYDVTNGAVIQGAPSSIQNSQLIERFQSEVQIPINCAEMRVIIHVSTATSAVGYTMRFDNFSFGPSEKLYSSQLSDWIDYIPTFNSGFTVGTGGSSVWQYRRNGSDIEIRGTALLGSSGFSMGTGAFSVSLPPGLTISSTITNGTAQMSDNANTGDRELFWAWTPTTSSFSFVGRTDAGVGTSISATAPFTWGAGDRLNINVKASVTGWSSSSQVASDNYSGRVIACAAEESFTQSIPNGIWTDITAFSASAAYMDPVGAWDNTNKRFNIKETGIYRFSYGTGFAPNGTGSRAVGIKISGSGPTRTALWQPSGADTGPVRTTTILYLSAGAYVSLMTYQSSGGALNCTYGILELEKISGPSQVLASESVNLRAVSATTTITASGSIVVFSSKEYDSHGIYSTATGAITIPSPGKYSFKVSTEAVSGASASVANVGTYMTLFKGIPGSGVSNTMFDNLRWPVVTTSLMPVILKGSTTVTANAGDVFYIVQQRDSTVSSYSLSGGAQTNVLVVEKVGN